VSVHVKNQIWNKLLARFVLPRGSEELVKEYTMKQLAINFQNWRSEMNTKFGPGPDKKYKISEGQWAIFLEHRSNPEFIYLSEANSELSKKNKYHHHLGTGGYKCQVYKWRQEDAEKKAAGLLTLFEQLGERTTNWICARKPRKTEAGISFDHPNVEEAAKNIYAMTAKQSQGSFKPQRERDILTAGLDNPEHPGRVRGISSKEGWKEGFRPQWEDLYMKHDRYKEELSDYFKQEAKKEFKDLMSQMLSNPPSSPQPSRDSRQSKKYKFPVPKLVSTFKKKKSKATIAGTARFLKGIARDLTSHTVDLAEHEEYAEKAEAMTTTIKIPTKADYKNVPKQYVPVRPLLTLEKLRKVLAGIKRLHDWYSMHHQLALTPLVCIYQTMLLLVRTKRPFLHSRICGSYFHIYVLLLLVSRIIFQYLTHARVTCRMQHDQQEILYGTKPGASAGKRIGYLNPILISEENHTFRIGKDNEELKGKTNEEVEERINTMKKDFEARYATYIGNAMLKFQDREGIMAPYNFK
jgi:hypothetical protein